MRYLAVALVCLAGGMLPAEATEVCPGNPDAIGTSRTITVDPAELPRIGRIQYRTTLPLEDHEVVITFDDGPLPTYTNRILDVLAQNCVKATYFLVGRMAQTYPDTVRRIFNEGHVIGTHSLSHPFSFRNMSEEQVADEVNGGIARVTAALGNPNAVAPFFRIPGLSRSNTAESYLAERSVAVWSADEVADDWRRGVTAKDIVRLALQRIEARDHRGVLLLHDIHPATAMAVPMLLKELKERGYKIVQAVPPGERPKALPPKPDTAVAQAGQGWPRVVEGSAAAAKEDAPKAPLHRKHAARKDRDQALADKLAKKKSKPQTAEKAEVTGTGTERGFFSFLQ
ncbi:polysaccharide deacetylase family protein [Pseudolabrys taiwanensis]|uniref:Chitooligosaccharide deacetylase n=1 Tax=Pseudolabrys taiwanensis TaxID=331696 RepID=A0A345ZTV1_9HYPH|nr:polysaccharide deacetylase family protein [Pseudolabrys taiwanensis]AXK80348.1 polysaccharide deacetylase family protein [Pseudolabrys taiwanensis]